MSGMKASERGAMAPGEWDATATQRLERAVLEWGEAFGAGRERLSPEGLRELSAALDEGADPNAMARWAPSRVAISALGAALELGEPEVADRLIALGADPSSTGLFESPNLMVAAKAALGVLPGRGIPAGDDRRAKYVKTADNLLAAGASPLERNPLGQTALMAIAHAMEDCPEMAERLALLMFKHPGVSARQAQEAGRWASERGRRRFEGFAAAYWERVELERALSVEGAKADEALRRAYQGARGSDNPSAREMERALARKAAEAVLAQGEGAGKASSMINGERMEAMPLLAYLGEAKAALRLLELGANPSARGPGGASALCLAAGGALGFTGSNDRPAAYQAMVRMILSRPEDSEEERASQRERQAEFKALFERLLELGADPSAADQSGSAPLHFLAHNVSVQWGREMIWRLLDAGADTQARNLRGERPGMFGPSMAIEGFESVVTAWRESRELSRSTEARPQAARESAANAGDRRPTAL